jgi:hypothetical protein
MGRGRGRGVSMHAYEGKCVSVCSVIEAIHYCWDQKPARDCCTESCDARWMHGGLGRALGRSVSSSPRGNDGSGGSDEISTVLVTGVPCTLQCPTIHHASHSVCTTRANIPGVHVSPTPSKRSRMVGAPASGGMQRFASSRRSVLRWGWSGNEIQACNVR